MRIIVPSKNNHEGSDENVDSSDEEDEYGLEEVDGPDGVHHHYDHDEEEREHEGETAHSRALIVFPNSNENGIIVEKTIEEGYHGREIHTHSNNNNNNEHLSQEDSISRNEEGAASIFGLINNSPVLSNNSTNNIERGANSDPEVLREVGRVKSKQNSKKAIATIGIRGEVNNKTIGAILCCSSLQSSDIRNCNKIIQK
ncbi:hypothetical protein L195_g047088, partial [Trifolium pratense]